MLQVAFLLTGGGKFTGGSGGCGGLVAKSCLTLATPWTVAHQAPLSIKFSRHEYWSRLPIPSPGDLPDPGIKPESLVSPVLASGFFTSWIIGEAQKIYNTVSIYLSHPIFFWCLCLLHRRLTFFVSWNQHYKSFPQVFKWYLNCYRYESFWRYDYIYTQTKKFGKLSSGHRTEKDQFSFQSQRKARPKNVQTIAQLHSFHMLAR